jgi:nitrogenase molybdenum-iron protein alpha/beta subunit
MNDSDTIYDGQTALREAVAELEVDHPEMIAVISTGTMDAQGALTDTDGVQLPKMIWLHTADFEGSLEQGCGKAAHALVNYALRKYSYCKKAQPQFADFFRCASFHRLCVAGLVS